jgi:tRNA(Ile)-lysidine synthase
LLRAWIAALGLPPLPARAVARIESELLRARDDAQARVAWPGAEVRAWRDGLYAARTRTALPADWWIAWEGGRTLRLPTGETIACVDTTGGDPAAALAALGPLRLAARQGGERMRLPGRTHSHAVKKLLQDLDVPPWERNRLPLAYATDGELLAVGDVLTSARMAGLGARLRIEPL